MSTYAIGDVQGCFQELQQLLSLINYNPQHDQLWFVGDLVNRGPASLQVLRFLKQLTPTPVITLGNHDLHLLALYYLQKPPAASDTLDAVLQAKDCYELCYWLRHQKIIHHDPKLKFTMVHAGILPSWDLTQSLSYAHEITTVLQADDVNTFFEQLYGNEPDTWDPSLSGIARLRFLVNTFTRMRFCSNNNQLELITKTDPGKQKTGFYPWYQIQPRKMQHQRIIFGHWAALRGHTGQSNVFATDSGCVWGNRLSALRLDDIRWFHVPAIQQC